MIDEFSRCDILVEPLLGDLEGALAFLVSEGAGFVTGQIIHVDGGFTRSGA